MMPVMVLQASLVHALPSSINGFRVLVITPVMLLQASTVHAFPSSIPGTVEYTVAPDTSHTSLVQAFPSLTGPGPGFTVKLAET